MRAAMLISSFAMPLSSFASGCLVRFSRPLRRSTTTVAGRDAMERALVCTHAA